MKNKTIIIAYDGPHSFCIKGTGKPIVDPKILYAALHKQPFMITDHKGLLSTDGKPFIHSMQISKSYKEQLLMAGEEDKYADIAPNNWRRLHGYPLRRRKLKKENK